MHEANDEDPTIVKSNGIYNVAWFIDRSGNPDIWMIKGDMSEWSDPQAIITSPNDEFYPTLVYNGMFHMSYFRIDAVTRVADVWYASSSDAVDWEEERVTDMNTADWVPRIFFYNDNTYIVWASDRSGNHDIYLTSNSGSGWSEPVQITDDALEDNFPHISVIGNKMYLVWSRFDKSGGLYGGPTSRILLSYSEDGASWSDPEIISDESVVATDVFPTIYSRDNESYVVWTSSLGDPYGDIVQWSFNSQTYEYLTNNPFPDYSPYVAGDYMVWVVDPDKTGVNRDIYIKEI
jgi:predicted GH43/DUF377 family glycosyl hydrolase